MTIVDWRTLAPRVMAPGYDVERAAWNARFGWETSPNWNEVERARAAGRLPGFAALDDGRLRGWCFFLRHGPHVQIGGLSAESPALASGLLQRIAGAPEAEAASGLIAFVPDLADTSGGSGWLLPVLRTVGFAVRSFAYLRRPLTAIAETPDSYRSFHAGRLKAVADLFARAYPGEDATRPFAPGGTAGEWLDYTAQLVGQTGCGVLLPWASALEEDSEASGRLVGAVLATSIGPQMAHIAQLAIDRRSQGQGRGRRLLELALSRLARRGFTGVSLLVADDNLHARRLYERLGFEATGQFASAWQAQPRRLSSAACSTGGVSTLR